MKTTGIFKIYKPDNIQLEKDAEIIRENTGMDIIFLRDPNGELWHEAQYLFDKDTLKIAFDENDVIVMLSEDATFLNPVNCAVAEVKKDNVPAGVDESQTWMYRDGEIIPRIYTQDEFIAQAEAMKQQLMADTSSIIAPLQDAVDIGEATDAEVSSLHGWKKYRVLLNRVDISKAPDIEWPELPEDVA
ncbi:tail fiber assembly protein [Enterobacter sp. EGD-HP1]|uniref:tail fiber assembly protein n=1 Tax=Enterobacter sp. EGD-HP1 TaxID=1357268 RepID=UPI0004DB4207|nr:tail fiber assembly protein [Enterobacter sp. EGD-HP1]KFA85882.1 tail fiber assembly protein [Enterobacter sp. EGD-HP1]